MMNFHLKKVQIIIEHVKNGIAIAKANNLPDELIDFIRTHPEQVWCSIFTSNM